MWQCWIVEGLQTTEYGHDHEIAPLHRRRNRDRMHMLAGLTDSGDGDTYATDIRAAKAPARKRLPGAAAERRPAALARGHVARVNGLSSTAPGAHWGEAVESSEAYCVRHRRRFWWALLRRCAADHYWRENSYGALNLAGNVVKGWYTLTEPRSAYVVNDALQSHKAAEHCTAAADADVQFPTFDGINLMFNQTLDCCARGGSLNYRGMGSPRRTASPESLRNGRSTSTTTSATRWATGSGCRTPPAPTTTYDSEWDVMSHGGICPATASTFGCIAVHAVRGIPRIDWAG